MFTMVPSHDDRYIIQLILSLLWQSKRSHNLVVYDISCRSPLPCTTTILQITHVMHYFLADHPSSTTFLQITPVLHYFLTDHPYLALLSCRSPLFHTTFLQITPALHSRCTTVLQALIFQHLRIFYINQLSTSSTLSNLSLLS